MSDPNVSPSTNLYSESNASEGPLTSSRPPIIPKPTPNYPNCVGTCKTCSGPSENECLSCYPGYNLDRSCANITGYILVNRTSDGSFLGYVSRYQRGSSLRAARTTSQIEDALYVSYVDSSSPFDFTLLNPGDTTFPLLGATLGTSSLGTDFTSANGNYAWVVDTDPTPQNSPAQLVGSGYNEEFGSSQSSESAIWSISPTTGELTAQWVNTDGSEQEAFIKISGNNLLFITGSLSGSSIPGTQVTLTFVQTSAGGCSGTCVLSGDYPWGNPLCNPWGLPIGYPWGNPLGNYFGNPMGYPAGNPVSNPWGNPIINPTGNSFSNPFGNPINGNPINNPLGGFPITGYPIGYNPYGNLMGTPLGNPIGNLIGSNQMGNPMGHPFGNFFGFPQW